VKPFVDALTLLTIIPAPIGRSNDSAPSRFAPLAFPVIGLLLGFGATGLLTLFDEFLPGNLAAALVVAALALITGALHVDGLADFSDGIFGGRDPESRIRIMKQPEIGAFGVTSIVLVLGVSWLALSSLAAADLWILLPVTVMISRTAPLVIMSITSYVSPNGLGTNYVDVPKPILLIVVVITLAISAVVGGGPTLSLAFVGLLAALVVGLLAKKRLGGANGDVYGAGVEISLAVCLVIAAGIVDAGAIVEPVWSGL